MTEPLQSPYSKVNIVDAEGNLINLGGGSGDSGSTIGGATAANQVTQTQVLQNIDTDLGTDITGAVMPSGGAGVRGWLSGIYTFLSSRLPALVNGRVPVDVASLNVTVENAQLEIANDAGNPIPVNGSVSVANFPATQAVSGTVAISNSSIEIANDAGNPIPVNGSVNIGNFPATTQIAGTVSISNSSIEIANDVGNPVPVSISNLSATTQLQISSLSLTSINTEFNFTFTGVRKYSFKPQGGGIRYSNVTGRVANSTLPYYTVNDGVEEVEDFRTDTFTGTLYFASPSNNVSILIKFWI